MNFTNGRQRVRRLGTRSAALEVRLELLRSDHVSPSLALTDRAIDLAEDWVDSGAHPKRLARELSNMHPGLALIANLARLLEESEPHLRQSLRMLRGSLQESNRLIAERLAELVPPHPVAITLSSGPTVRDALAYLGCRAVYVLESRPGGEGTQIVQQLRRLLRRPEQEAEVHLIEATTIGNVVPHVDCAVVEADAISRSGALRHKVGTLPLALCCWHFQKPFYVVGQSLQKLDHEFDDLPRNNGVLEAQIFDYTGAELITHIVTERAMSLPASMRAGCGVRQPGSLSTPGTMH
jgi:translation initiation factor eIF-2B subunit delta